MSSQRSAASIAVDVVGRCRAEVELDRRSVDRPQPARGDRPRRRGVAGSGSWTARRRDRRAAPVGWPALGRCRAGRRRSAPRSARSAVQGAVRRSEVGARAHGDDRAALRDPPGDPGEATRVAEVFGVHADHRSSSRRPRRTAAGRCPRRRRGRRATRTRTDRGACCLASSRNEAPSDPDCIEIATPPSISRCGHQRGVEADLRVATRRRPCSTDR